MNQVPKFFPPIVRPTLCWEKEEWLQKASELAGDGWKNALEGLRQQVKDSMGS